MKHISCGAMVLLACAMLVMDTAIPQARGPSSRAIQDKARSAEKKAAGARPIELAELEAWLERLKGRFTIKAKSDRNSPCSRPSVSDPGSVDALACSPNPDPAKYESDVECQSIGNGAGLRCVFGQTRLSAATDKYLQELNDASQRGTPSPVDRPVTGTGVRMLFGVDPVARKISFMVVGDSGGGSGAMSSLEDHAVTFKSDCKDLAWQLTHGGSAIQCTHTLQIEAPPGGQQIRMRGNTIAQSLDGRTTASTASFSWELQRVAQPSAGETNEQKK